MSDLPDRILLHHRTGKTFKVFRAKIVNEGKGFVVEVAYGRGGAGLRVGSRPAKPVSRATAQEVYAALVTERLAEGYIRHVPGGGGDAAVPSPVGAAARRGQKRRVWAHATLGRFAFDLTAWTGKLDLRAFQDFGAGRHAAGKFELRFETDRESDLPCPEAVALAVRLHAGHRQIAAKVITALWDDFNGRGPGSGMYWHGDLDAVVRGMVYEDEPSPPRSAKDVRRLMGLDNVVIPNGVKPVAVLNFSAAFENEHGVGVLTDGRAILGIGYSNDVARFDGRRRRSRRRRRSVPAR